MANKLNPDFDGNQAKRIFEILADECDTFEGFNSQEVEALSQVFKLLSFKPNDDIVTRGDFIDYFGIIVQGTCMVTHSF
jgi:CRP-like cAMP-binding protein